MGHLIGSKTKTHNIDFIDSSDMLACECVNPQMSSLISGSTAVIDIGILVKRDIEGSVFSHYTQGKHFGQPKLVYEAECLCAVTKKMNQI